MKDNSMLIRRALTAAGVGAMVALMGPAAHAQSLNTFAEFGKSAQTPTNNGFDFVNSGTSGNFGVLNGTIPINFQYDTADGYDGTGYNTIPATLSFSAVATAGATNVGGTITQAFSSMTMSITANTPVAGDTNLLTATFTAGGNSSLFLSGSNLGGSASFNASNSNALGVTNFSSDFLDFNNTALQTILSEQVAIAFSGVNDEPGPGNGLTVNANGYVDSFEASGTATFSADQVPNSQTPPPAVPEPSALALAAVPLIGMLARRRR